MVCYSKQLLAKMSSKVMDLFTAYGIITPNNFGAFQKTTSVFITWPVNVDHCLTCYNPSSLIKHIIYVHPLLNIEIRVFYTATVDSLLSDHLCTFSFQKRLDN